MARRSGMLFARRLKNMSYNSVRTASAGPSSFCWILLWSHQRSQWVKPAVLDALDVGPLFHSDPEWYFSRSMEAASTAIHGRPPNTKPVILPSLDTASDVLWRPLP